MESDVEAKLSPSDKHVSEKRENRRLVDTWLTT
jgi:hypothetical protein